MTRAEKESGVVAAEAAIGMLLLFFVIGVMWALGRYVAAGQGVDAAASDAARAASLARSAGEAYGAAQSAAAATLADNDVPCDAPVIEIDTSGFAVPIGTPATIKAVILLTIRCFSFVSFPDFVGSGPGAADRKTPGVFG